MVRTLLRHGLRNVRRGGLPFFFATLMTALGLFAFSIFITVLLNFQRLTGGIGAEVGAVAFLEPGEESGQEMGGVQAEEVRATISLLPGVSRATLVSPVVAMARVRKALGAGAPGSDGALLEGTGGIGLPWVVQIAADPSADIELSMVLDQIRKLRGVEEVMHPTGDMARIQAVLRLLEVTGLFLAILIGLVVVIVVSNTVKLTLFARRDEIAIMKLVGATDNFIKLPSLFEGLVQGLGGAVIALLALTLTHATVAGVIEIAIGNALGTFTLERLPLVAALWIVVGGAALGLLAAAVSIGRFLRV